MLMDKVEIKRRMDLVVSEHGGIIPYCEAFYIFSIVYSADRASDAFTRFDTAQKTNLDAILIASTIHEALGHSAALSRFFWPARNTVVAMARATKLRGAFALDDLSPLRDRDLRDALEHFDERLDQFLLTNDTGQFFPMPMIGDHTLADEPTAKIFKLVDPAQGYFVILGKKYKFGSLISEVHRISRLAHTMMNTGRLS